MAVQRDEAWLKSATPDQVQAAYDAGELDDVMNGVQGAGVHTFPDVGSTPGLQRDRA